MTHRIYQLIILLVLISCSSKKAAVTVVDDLMCPSEGLFATDYKYVFFGKIGYNDRSFKEDTLLYPPIEGLVHGSVFTMCPVDTCFAERSVFALRCPPIQPLLDWVADTLNTFAHECPIGNGLLTYNEKELDIPNKHFATVDDLCDYYIDQLNHAYDKWHCTGEGDHNVINEQAGLLLADCWKIENLYTFYRIDWYDWLSAGNNVRESWWTVDATSGRLLRLDDLVVPEMKDSLAILMMPRLINASKEYFIRKYDFNSQDSIGILERADGVALIPEGLVIYFYPYNLGSGADGEFEAVIPYDKLDGLLKEPLSAALIPSSLDENIDVRQYVWKDGRPNIDLFGIEMVGTPKRILRELVKNPYLDIDLGPEGFMHHNDEHFSCRVLLDNIPFGMTISYGNDRDEDIVKAITFISSETEHRVLDTIVRKVTEYYGGPHIYQKPEEYHMWFHNRHVIHARPMHRDKGGCWTFYIY